jgi:hypothetical protein
LVFVDFYNKKDEERPDFYILSVTDWVNLVKKIYHDDLLNGNMIINTENVPIFPKQIIKLTGKPYRGINISNKNDIQEYKENWIKITDYFN